MISETCSSVSFDETLSWRDLWKDILPTKQKSCFKRSNRKSEESRKFFAKLGVQSSSTGSCYYEIGNTKVVAAISGPRECQRNELTYVTIGYISCHVTFANFAYPSKRISTDACMNLESIIEDALSSVVCLTRYPASSIDVFVVIIDDDGAVLPSALTAASLALIDASIDCYDVLIGSSILIADDIMIVDPTKAEETQLENTADSCSILNIGYLPNFNQIAAFLQTGSCSPSKVADALQKSISCIPDMHATIRFFVAQYKNNKNS